MNYRIIRETFYKCALACLFFFNVYTENCLKCFARARIIILSSIQRLAHWMFKTKDLKSHHEVSHFGQLKELKPRKDKALFPFN